jgi:signal transduction histidine kinase
MDTATTLSDDAYRRLGAIIAQVQSRFILRAPPREVFEPLLTDLLGFTESEYGFIAELLHDPLDQHPFLRIQVLTDISWDEPTRLLYAEHLSGKRPVEFHNMATLFGAAVTGRTTVISNDPATDSRSGGRPSQHPPLRSFLGAPLFHGGEMVGVVGLSNRPGGYDEGLARFLEPLFSSVGSILGAVRMEAARRSAEETVLQNRVALVAAEAAHRANAAKTEFLSRMSHELRTPLNAVLGFAQLLQLDAKTPLSTLQALHVGHIERAGSHLLAMIDDVLDLSRIESGNLPMAMDTVRVEQVVQESIALVAPTAAQAGLQLEVAGPQAQERPCSLVRADRLRLRQVLVNLLSNAVKYNRRGGDISVQWSCLDDSRQVAIDVSDSGIGLTDEQLAHLFEPFNRLGAERTKVDGTGIGLVISRRLVHSMGGEIEVSSVAGVGSRFRVLLPAAPASSAGSPPTEPGALVPGAATGPEVARRTVLYADDNALNVEVALAILQTRADLRVVVARSGRSALEVAQRDPPDLMLLDMHLGDMTGVQLLQRFAADPVLAQVPCVAVSADAMPLAIAEAERAGFKAYLTKPLNVRTFLGCVDRMLKPPH